MIKVLIGNILESRKQTLVNTVNSIGVMGKGIAQLFKDKYPAMYKDYRSRCRSDLVKPGLPYLYTELDGTSILNFPTKDHWRSPSRLEYIIEGLDFFIGKYQEWGIESIAFPPLGCGNGGLDWKDVGPIMYQKLSKLEIPVELYAPFGTQSRELTHQFLTKTKTNTKQTIQRKVIKKIKPEWLTILEVLHQLENTMYAPATGRTIFQHICYTLTESGVNTGFRFSFGDYGPFSHDVKKILTLFANSNLIQEEKFGRMIKITPGVEYEKKRTEYLKQIDNYMDKVSKTTDLYCRIKNTKQSEEVVSVFFIINKLKKEKPDLKLSEELVYDRIFEWKKKWRKDEKGLKVGEAIRSLVVLEWTRLEYSDKLPVYKLAV